MPIPLTIRLLGRFEVVRDGQVIPTSEWRGQKPKDLLKILLLARGRYVANEQLLDWLWPGSDPSTAQTNLRSVVSDLRKTLEPERARGRDSSFITTEHDGYAFNMDASVTVDIIQFEKAAAELTTSRADIEGASALYRGDLLEEDPYAEWALRERERLRELRLGLLNKLAEAYLTDGLYAQSIATSEQVLAIDPAQETSWRTVMQAQAANGDRAAALASYERCRTTLVRELGIEPSAETRALHTRLLQDDREASGEVVSAVIAKGMPRWQYRLGAIGLGLWALIGILNLVLALNGIIGGEFISSGDPGIIALPYLQANPAVLDDLNNQLYLLFPTGWLLLIGYIGWATALRRKTFNLSLLWLGLAAGIADGAAQTLARALGFAQLAVLPAAYSNATLDQQLTLITVWDVMRQLASICGMLSLFANPAALLALALAMLGQARLLTWTGVGLVAASVVYYLLPAGGLAFFAGLGLAFGLRVWLLAVAGWLWRRTG